MATLTETSAAMTSTMAEVSEVYSTPLMKPEASAYPEKDAALPAIIKAADQSILHVTLRGPTLLFTILALVLSTQYLHPSNTTILISIAPLFQIVYNDYKAFLSLGPGGTPSTFPGYLKVTYLRLFTLSNPYTAQSPSTLDSDSKPRNPSIGLFSQAPQTTLPYRRGPRPKSAGIAPHRQLDQPGPLSTYLSLRAAFTAAALAHPSIIRTGVISFEKTGLALVAHHSLNNTCNGEIVHVHHSDRSMHMNLHPDDAAVVLERGWGQRHPLAGGTPMGLYVQREFVMVYAPRDEAELAAVCRIVEAAAWWVAGERIEVSVPRQVPRGKDE